MPFNSEISQEDNSAQALRIFIAKSAKVIVGTAVIGAAIGFGSFFLQSPQWTAKMTVQIGQITSPAAGGINATKLVEAQFTASDRMNLPSFRLAILKNLGLPAPDSSNANSALVFDSLRATPAKSLDLINVQVSGYSRDDAIRALNASFKQLAESHNKDYQPAVERMNSELSNVMNRLTVAEQDYQRTFSALKNVDNRSVNQDLFATNVLAVISARILALGQQKMQFEESLAHVRTYPTRVLGDVYAPKRPSSPGKFLFTAAGAAIGLIAGLLIAMARNTRRT